MSDTLHPLRVVIAGPPDSGKLTALRAILGKVPPKRRGKLIPRKLGEDIILAIDIRLGSGATDRPLRFLTVQGSPKEVRTWRTLLRSVDGVVFVADARPGNLEVNRSTHHEIVELLHGWNKAPESLAWVFAYNRRDESDDSSAKALSEALNPNGLPEFDTVATSGYGLFQAFKSLFSQLIEKNSKPDGAQVADATDTAEDVAVSVASDAATQEVAETQAEPEGDAEPPAKSEPSGVPKRQSYGLAASMDLSQETPSHFSFTRSIEQEQTEEVEERDETPPEEVEPTVAPDEPLAEEEAFDPDVPEPDPAEEPPSGLVGFDAPPDKTEAIDPESEPEQQPTPAEEIEQSEPEGEQEPEEGQEPSAEQPEDEGDVQEDSSEPPAAVSKPEQSPGGPSFHFPEMKSKAPSSGIPHDEGDPDAPSWKKLLTRHKRN